MQSVQIGASEIWFTLIFCVIMYLFKDELKQKKSTKLLLIVCITRLLSDAVSWSFDGESGVIFGTVTRLSNYLTFVSNDLVSVFFSAFLWDLIKKENEKPCIVLKAYWLLECIAIGALTLNLYFGWFYSFDGSNLYSRGTYYQMTHIAPIVALVVVFWMLIKYRKRFNRNIKFLGWTYLTLMTFATAYEFMNFGLSLQTYAQTFSALVAFFVCEIEVRQNLISSQKKLKTALETERKMDEELRKQQEQLSIALEDAKQANQAKTIFLNNMSHDIRTPMNAIIGYNNLMKKKITDPKLLDYQEKIGKSGNLLLSIINNVLDMARIESGKATVDANYLKVGGVIKEVCEVFEVETKKKDIQLSYKINVEHRDIVCDIVKVKEVLANLISNAIKYTTSGGTVRAELNEIPCTRDGYVKYKMQVIDTGIGMSKEYLPTLFDSFTRERNTTTGNVAGTGLGMAIVKRLVDLMGGSIEVESELGKGTTFTVILEHRIANEVYYKQKTNEITDEAMKKIIAGKHILLAEDNELNAEIATVILEDVGAVIDRVEDGVKCVAKMEEKPAGTYDLILMDVQMPNMDGYKATQVIRRLPDKAKANIPIIAMTANAFEEDKKKSLEMGMNGHIAKPINIENIQEVLISILN